MRYDRELTEYDRVAPCYSCGCINVHIQQNAAGKFRFYCPRCGTRTSWNKKAQAVVEWYNMYLYGNAWEKKVDEWIRTKKTF